MPTLTDTHAHLDSTRFTDDLEEVLARAEAAGVRRIVAIGCDIEGSRRGLALAERWPMVWATVGVHPTYVMEEPHSDWREQLADMARHPRCVALGETGLDYYHPAPEGSAWEGYTAKQKEFFAGQLEIAAAAGKNVVVHQRDRSGTACWEDIKAMIQPWHGKLSAVFHCFLHPWAEAAPLVALGHRISFTGIATYKSAPEVAACAAKAPDGSFFLETDSPYLAPVPHRGKRNEPAFVRATAEAVASVRGVPLERLAAVTETAAGAFFGWNSGPS
ncbi:MAG: ycfH [Verrucomicrobiales bacterium]|nr:ycfH [Verrucomicrobiales bacterium]